MDKLLIWIWVIGMIVFYITTNNRINNLQDQIYDTNGLLDSQTTLNGNNYYEIEDLKKYMIWAEDRLYDLENN